MFDLWLEVSRSDASCRFLLVSTSATGEEWAYWTLGDLTASGGYENW